MGIAMTSAPASLSPKSTCGWNHVCGEPRVRTSSTEVAGYAAAERVAGPGEGYLVHQGHAHAREARKGGHQGLQRNSQRHEDLWIYQLKDTHCEEKKKKRIWILFRSHNCPILTCAVILKPGKFTATMTFGLPPQRISVSRMSSLSLVS